MLINWLQEKNPISRESHCQTIKSQHKILKLIYNDGKTSITSSSNFDSVKAASKEHLSLSNFLYAIKSRVFKQKARYNFAVVKLVFFTVDKRANIVTVSRLKKKSPKIYTIRRQ